MQRLYASIQQKYYMKAITVDIHASAEFSTGDINPGLFSIQPIMNHNQLFNPLIYNAMNKVILIGHLSEGPTTQKLNFNNKVVTFTMTTPTYYTDRNGDILNLETIHTVKCLEDLADQAEKYLPVNSLVSVEGRLITSEKKQEYDTLDTSCYIEADSIEFLDLWS